ncbi:MAG TPA: CmcJ/NvfI family oxidoreductase [Candidatus Binataceae bacterium]|nr:CmcJ/NvfI family oxidoreductase [Candidatus Binataceae bacterium]
MDIEAKTPADHIEGIINYLEYTGQRPVNYLYEPPPGVPMRSGAVIKHRLPVYNGRPIADRLTLDTAGFALLRHETKVVNFYDAEEVRQVYYPEVAELVKRHAGAARVVVFDHNVRCRPMAKAGLNGAREPVKFAHNDYTLKSGPQRVRDLMGAEADELLRHRFMEINVWRPIRGPVEETPLAVCDARSMKLEDFIPTDLKYRDRTGEVYSLKFNPAHKWYYFPRMQRDEVLLLKCYDSADDGRARFTGHTGFEDTTSLPDAPPRESIEARMLVFCGP